MDRVSHYEHVGNSRRQDQSQKQREVEVIFAPHPDATRRIRLAYDLIREAVLESDRTRAEEIEGSASNRSK